MATKVPAGGEEQKRKTSEWLRSRLLSANGIDALIALTLWFGFFVLVVWRAEEIGVGYDEPIYGGYAFKYLAWLQYLWESGLIGLKSQMRTPIHSLWLNGGFRENGKKRRICRSRRFQS